MEQALKIAVSELEAEKQETFNASLTLGLTCEFGRVATTLLHWYRPCYFTQLVDAQAFTRLLSATTASN